MGGEYYKRERGISQGCVVSSLLCNFYYGHMEAAHLTSLVHPDDLFMRLVDDFLFVSPSEERARWFLSLMQQGLYCTDCVTST